MRRHRPFILLPSNGVCGLMSPAAIVAVVVIAAAAVAVASSPGVNRHPQMTSGAMPRPQVLATPLNGADDASTAAIPHVFRVHDSVAVNDTLLAWFATFPGSSRVRSIGRAVVAGSFTPEAVAAVTAAGRGLFQYVEAAPRRSVTVSGAVPFDPVNVPEGTSSWVLDRLDQRYLPLDSQYRQPAWSTGACLPAAVCVCPVAVTPAPRPRWRVRQQRLSSLQHGVACRLLRAIPLGVRWLRRGGGVLIRRCVDLVVRL